MAWGFRAVPGSKNLQDAELLMGFVDMGGDSGQFGSCAGFQLMFVSIGVGPQPTKKRSNVCSGSEIDCSFLVRSFDRLEPAFSEVCRDIFVEVEVEKAGAVVRAKIEDLPDLVEVVGADTATEVPPLGAIHRDQTIVR